MLITLRRLLAAVLAIVFILLFVVALLTWRVEETIASPEYLKSELVKTDIFNFLYDDVAVSLLADALDDPEGYLNDDLKDLEIRPDEDAAQIVGFVRDFLPPEELQLRVNHVIDEFIPYISGETDEFAIKLELEDRITAWPALVEARLGEAEFTQRLVDAVLAPAIFDALNSLSQQGLDFTITRERAKEIARDVAPPAWIEAQVVNATQSAADYLTRRDEQLTITIQFADQVPRLTQAVKSVLNESNAESFLFDKLIEPTLRDALGEFTRISYGIEITDAEINVAIRAVAPPAWIREQRNAIIDNVTAYISADTDSLAINVDLEERAQTAADQLIALAKSKLTDVIDSIPPCSGVQAAVQSLNAVTRGSLPDCKPPQLGAQQLIDTLAAPFESEIENLIVNQIPASFTFTEDDLGALVGESSIDTINDVRTWVSEGFTYTQDDFTDDINNNDSDFTVDDLDLVRDILDNDKVFTQVDFTDRLLGDRPAAKEDFDQIRDWVGMGQRWWFVIFVLPAFLLLIIAFLGGRNWNSRLKWAAFMVFLPSLVLWAATAPVYDNYAKEELDNLVVDATEGLDREVTREVVTEAITRGIGVAERWKDGFGSRAAQFAIGSGIVLLLSTGYSLLKRGGDAPRGPSAQRAERTMGLDPETQKALDMLRADKETTRLQPAPEPPPPPT